LQKGVLNQEEMCSIEMGHLSVFVGEMIAHDGACWMGVSVKRARVEE
jgi:hypothetical protein